MGSKDSMQWRNLNKIVCQNVDLKKAIYLQLSKSLFYLINPYPHKCNAFVKVGAVV